MICVRVILQPCCTWRAPFTTTTRAARKAPRRAEICRRQSASSARSTASPPPRRIPPSHSPRASARRSAGPRPGGRSRISPHSTATRARCTRFARRPCRSVMLNASAAWAQSPSALSSMPRTFPRKISRVAPHQHGVRVHVQGKLFRDLWLRVGSGAGYIYCHQVRSTSEAGNRCARTLVIPMCYSTACCRGMLSASALAARDRLP